VSTITLFYKSDEIKLPSAGVFFYRSRDFFTCTFIVSWW